MQELNKIIEFEESEDYITAFEEYKKLYSINQEFEIWKHYYFFLWYIRVGDFPLGLVSFVEENEVDIELKEIGLFGIKTFNENPEALFILGYTISLFPYYFGEFEKLESDGRAML